MTKIQHVIVNGQISGSWTNASSTWGHPLHRICSRVGAVPPKIAHYYITKYSEPGQTVLDPFSGKGTIPFEAALNNRFTIGNDVSQEAHVLTRAKLCPPSINEFLEEYLPTVKKLTKDVKSKDIQEDFRNEDLQVFYEKNTLRNICKLRYVLLNRRRRSDADFFLSAIVLGLLHGSTSLSFSIPCSHAYSMSPRYVRKYIDKYNKIHPNSQRFEYRKKDIWKGIEEKTKIVYRAGLPDTFKKGCTFSLDAAYLLKKLHKEDCKVDLILTSPPYFDAQTYAWDNWLRLWFLGKEFKTVKKKLFHTGSKTIYLNQMKEYVDLMYNVLSDNSPCFLILGDVKRRDEVIKTAELLASTLLDNGTEFHVKRVWRDRIPKNRKSLIYINENDGVKYERILELHKGDVRRNKKSIQW